MSAGELDSFFLVSQRRRELLEFLMNACALMEVAPIVKYTALSFFADRFLPSLHGGTRENLTHSWLMDPLRESNLQLFVLISLWIASKSHDTSPISSRTLKSFGDIHIKDQHFTMRDFVEAEIIFMEVLNYGIGSSNVAFIFLEEFLIQFRAISRAGELVSCQACMDIMDLLYETEEIALLYSQPHLLAAVILVTSYVLTVPRQSWEFPLLPWVKFTASYEEDHVMQLVEQVLEHILVPT
ncbi:cyclin J18 isoform X2 [Wolffia australiana]